MQYVLKHSNVLTKTENIMNLLYLFLQKEKRYLCKPTTFEFLSHALTARTDELTIA